MEDFKQYLTPGIYTEELAGPIIGRPGISATVVALVGDSKRDMQNSEVTQLTGTTPVQLQKLGIKTATITVKDRFSGVTYVSPADFTVATQAGADATAATADDTTTITRVGTGAIPTGAYVTVSYSYADPSYYNVARFASYEDVRAVYGEPFDTSGAITSPLSLAAFLAFQNGAGSLVISPVKAAGATPTTGEWATAISNLANEPGVNVVVPVSGDTAIHALVSQHVTQMAASSDFRRGFVGRDGSSIAVTSTDLKTQAAGYSNSRMVVVGPTKLEFYEGNTRKVISLGGQYAAAAVAGVHASRGVNIPLTRKTVQGFYSIPNQPTEATLIDLQRSGVLTLFQKRSGEVIVRHGLTTNTASDYTRELSVVAAKDRLVVLVNESLEFQGLIGSVITETTPDLVVSALVGALETARANGLIFDYAGVQYRLPPDAPTAIVVKFSYRPSMPLNYIQVQFSIDTTTGTIDFVDAGV